jgi:hypothetical protein
VYAFTLDLDDWLSLDVFDSEGPMLLTPKNLRLREVTTDEPFNVEDSVPGINVENLFRGFTNSSMSEISSGVARDE